MYPRGQQWAKAITIDLEGQGKGLAARESWGQGSGSATGLWPQRKVATVRPTVAVQGSVGRIEAPSLCLPSSQSPFGTTNWKPEVKGS